MLGVAVGQFGAQGVAVAGNGVVVALDVPTWTVALTHVVSISIIGQLPSSPNPSSDINAESSVKAAAPSPCTS
jgi:hypothetical protein